MSGFGLDRRQGNSWSVLPLLAGSTLSDSRSKAAVAKNVVAVNGCLLDFLRTHPPGQQRKFKLIAATIACLARAAAGALIRLLPIWNRYRT